MKLASPLSTTLPRVSRFVSGALVLAAAFAAPTRADDGASASTETPAPEAPAPDARALFAAGRYAEASAAFFAMWERDHANTGALFNAAIAARKANLLPEARRAYDTLLSATPDDLDAVFGLADVEQQLGADEHARALLLRYVNEEKRPARTATLEKARAALAEVEQRIAAAASARVAAPVAEPVVEAVVDAVAAPGAAASEGASSSTTADVPTPAAPILEDGEPAKPAAPDEEAAPPRSNAGTAADAPSTWMATPFAGDVLTARALVQEARTLLERDDAAGARALLARAIALSPADAEAVALDARAAASESTRCSVDEAIARGERALAVHDADAALRAFQRARVCSPERAAPLWGLARAWEARGDVAQARRHARLYVASTAKDRDASLAARAERRLEQPDAGIDN